MPVVTSPTELPWVLVPECICPIIDNQCYRPGPYSKPLICAHSHIKNISEHLSAVSEKSLGINTTFEKGGQDIGSCSTLLIILQLLTFFVLFSFFTCYIVKNVFFRSYVVNRKWGARRRHRRAAVQLTELRPRTSAQLTASVQSGGTPSMAVRSPRTLTEMTRPADVDAQE